MRSESAVRDAEARVPTPVPAPSTPRSPPSLPDPELERLAAEARYHRERFELHRARVISASPHATTLGRLRELERTATAAQERLTHAERRARR
jgi:hypothetical protein